MDKCVSLPWRVATHLSCDYEKFVVFKINGRTHYNHLVGEENEIQILILGQNFTAKIFSWDITVNKEIDLTI